MRRQQLLVVTQLLPVQLKEDEDDDEEDESESEENKGDVGGEPMVAAGTKSDSSDG